MVIYSRTNKLACEIDTIVYDEMLQAAALLMRLVSQQNQMEAEYSIVAGNCSLDVATCAPPGFSVPVIRRRSSPPSCKRHTLSNDCV